MYIEKLGTIVQICSCLRGFPTFKPKINTTVLNAFNGISTNKMDFFLMKKKIHIDQSIALQMVTIFDFWSVTGTPVS